MSQTDEYPDLRDSREQFLPGRLGRGTFFVGSTPPRRAVWGQGAVVVDETGHELIDFHNNFSALVHGHAHPEVTRAAVEACQRGSCFGLPSEPELALADELVPRFPWAEQIRFTNSGTEATMTAVRMARAITGRDSIVMLSPAYHGTPDTLLPAPNATRGIPAAMLALSLTVPPNDLAALEAAVDTAPGGVAAIILDLAPALGGCVPLERGYVDGVAKLARGRGALLIVDEVISFRHYFEGYAMGAYGLEPDLLALGKVIGGGYPVGAVLGTSAVMAVLVPGSPGALLQGGTFNANPVTMSAGYASMRAFDKQAADRLRTFGEAAGDRFGQIAAEFGWMTTGVGSVFRLAPRVGDSDVRRHELWWAAYRQGLLLSSSGVICASTVMDDDLLHEAATRLQAAFADIAH